MFRCSIIRFKSDQGKDEMLLVVKPLAACQEFMDTVVSWYDDAWGYLRPDKPNHSKLLYKSRLNTMSIPIAYVVFQDDIPVGTFSLVPNTYGIGNSDLTMLNSIYVLSHERGNGVGKEIVKIAENIASKNFGVKMLQIGTVEYSLVKFYENLGWSFAGEDILEDNHVVYVLQKDIKLLAEV